MASAHVMVDGYGNIFAPLLPLLIPKMHLSLAAAGTLTMCFSVSGVGCAGGVRESCRPLAAGPPGTGWPGHPVSAPSLIALARHR